MSRARFLFSPYIPLTFYFSANVSCSYQLFLRQSSKGSYQSSSASETPSLESMSKARFDGNGREAPTIGSYTAWLGKHPSALDSFDEMMNSAKGKSLIIFLDYDGTLSPIVEDPDKAFMSDKMRRAVEEVVNVFPTAIVSGRDRNKLKNFVQLENVTYAGSHGMDILITASSFNFNNNTDHHIQTGAVQDKGDEVIYFQPAKEFLPQIQEILKKLEEKTKNIDGALVEDNKFCVSVHFRCVNAEDVDGLKEKVKSVMKSYSDFRITGGRKVLEIRPRIDWDKGRALEYIIQNLGVADSNDYFPLYLGDDKTDEDAFKVINEIGRGYSIVVSNIPKETRASYSLRDTNDVGSFLRRVAKWGRSAAAHSSPY